MSDPWRAVERIGDATLYLGDCLEILPTLPKVDALVTDPPYGILNLAGDGSTPAVRKSPRQRGSGVLKDRILNQSDVFWDVAPTKAALAILLRSADTAIIWGGNYFELPPARAMLCWDKDQPWENFSQIELAWSNLRCPAAIYRESATRAVKGKEHPTQKPTGLMRWCIKKAGMPAIVLDPYMGSGTTGVACAHLGRKFIGIEIGREYFEIACSRIEQAYSQGRLFDDRAVRDDYEQVTMLDSIVAPS